MPKVKDVIEHLKGYDPESHIATAIWCEEDVIEYAKNEMDGQEITREQAQEILDEMDRKQDSELGISWTTIQCYLEEHK